MTKYKHVTASVVGIGEARINLSKTQLFVDVSAKGWAQANELVKRELAKDSDKSFYKVASRKYLWENYFQSFNRINTLEFWEEVLEEISNRDELEIHVEMKAVIRKTLMEVIGHYLNANCVLLPMVAPRSKETPGWHSHEKAKITGSPYERLFEWYRDTCKGSRHRYKRAGARYRLIFSSIRLPTFDAYSEAVDEKISIGLREAGISGDEMSDCRKFLQLLASKCTTESGRKPFTTYLSASGSMRLTPKKRVFAEVMEDMPSHDPILMMKRYVEARLIELDITHKDEWLAEIVSWVSTPTNADISPQYTDVVFLCEWMSKNGLKYKRSCQITRQRIVKTVKEADGSISFFEFLRTQVESRHAKSRIVRNLVDFFAHSSDGWLEKDGEPTHSPLNETDKKRFADTSASERGKSNKPVLPRRIIELAKQILIEDDYAFSRKFENQHIKMPVGSNPAAVVFVPTLSNLLYLILSVPIRTAQAVMLDSGEADEVIVSLDGETAKNKHPLAQKGRRLGYARRFAGTSPGTQFSGLFVNTNKEAVHKQKGYEIPFHDAMLMKVLASQRLFQEQYNPINIIVDRSHLSFKDWRYNGAHSDQLESYSFLFRDITRGSRRWDLPSRNTINKHWLRLLQEIQLRLESEGTPVQLVWEDSNGSLKTEFTLHSLRVSNITHFIEAGVPLHVLAEFLAGHQTLVMTLYYTKLGPRKIHEIISEASKNLVDSDEDEFFDNLREMSEDMLRENLVGRDDGFALLPSGDPGLWHVDIDGICTAGKTMCEQGLERKDPENGSVIYEKIHPDGFNCALCRFYVTGPAFLAGQVTVANSLFYAIRQRSEQQEEIYRRVKDARARGNNRAARKEQDYLDKVTIELEERIASLGSRVANIYASLHLMDDQDKRGSEKTALITKLDTPEIEARVSEASIFESVEWASQALEFFPQLPDSNARFRKGILLERMAEENGLKRLLLKLSDDELLRASNRLTIMMTELYGARETDDLMSGRLMLEEIGGLSSFETLVGRAIKLVEDDIESVSDQSKFIGCQNER
ncbi:MAG: VPA1269 family protein [Marinobacter sp.]|uniref:VPA1269 family protein n=1 Tax=Marinobacter sp. TaxID=50741 RepID=UPI0032991C1E